MIARMDRIELVFLRSEMQDVVSFLQEQGVVHVEEVPLAVENHPGYLHRVHLPETERAELAELEELDGLMKETAPLLSARATHTQMLQVGPKVEGWSLEEQRRKVRGWHRNLRSLNRRRLNIQDNIAVLENYAAVLKSLAPMLSANQAVLGKNARALVLDGYTADGIEALRGLFSKAVGPEARYLQQSMGKNRNVLVVLHPEGKRDAVDTVIADEEITAVESPDKEVTGDSVPSVLDKINKKIAALRADLDEILSELQAYSEKYCAEVAALQEVLKNRITQIQVSENFAQSHMVGVAHGYIPSEEYSRLRSNLKTRFGDRAAVGKLPMSDVDLYQVPSKRVLPDWAKPYEVIMNMMKAPTYGTYDPTILVALSFTFFYGFILGDAAYGLILVLIGWLVKRKWGHVSLVHSAFSILQYMGVSSIIFGVIYGEYFGNFLENAIDAPYLFHRAHETTVFLYMAIAIGAIHIPLALIMGIREAYAHGHRKHGEERLAMLLGLIALATALAASAGYFPLGSGLGLTLAGIIFVIAIFYFIRSMGAMAPMGVIEIIGLAANVLSYARLMALSIASIAFADIANLIPTGAEGLFAFLFGLVGAALVHTLNIGIGVFSPGIHSLRLNLVEFLPKFYEPAGRTYEPFRKEMAW